MKKVLTLILAALLIISLLPLSVLADEAAPLPTDEAKVKVYYGPKKSFTLTLKADTGAAYIAVNEDGTYGKWTEAEAPADKYVKFEYIAGTPGVAKATFKNFQVDASECGAAAYTAHTIEFLTGAVYNVEIELIGENSMVQTKSASIKCSNEGTISIYGGGSLSLTQTMAASGTFWGNAGDLSIKDVTLSFAVDPGSNSAHHCIFMAKGSVTMDNVKIPSSSVRGGSLIYLGTTDKEAGGTGKGRSTPTTDVNRTITIKNCDITATSGTGNLTKSASPAKISNSTLKLTKTSSSGKSIFEPAPEFEGDFSAIAGLAKNADKLDKLKEYNANKLGSYTYIYAVPGIVELLPKEPEPTVPEVSVPDETTPEVTQPDETTPDATQPQATQPQATQPAESKPAESKPAATTPNATEPADTDAEEGGNPLMTVVIIIVVLIVLAGGAVVTLIILKKKGIIK